MPGAGVAFKGGGVMGAVRAPWVIVRCAEGADGRGWGACWGRARVGDRLKRLFGDQ